MKHNTIYREDGIYAQCLSPQDVAVFTLHSNDVVMLLKKSSQGNPMEDINVKIFLIMQFIVIVSLFIAITYICKRRLFRFASREDMSGEEFIFYIGKIKMPVDIILKTRSLIAKTIGIDEFKLYPDDNLGIILELIEYKKKDIKELFLELSRISPVLSKQLDLFITHPEYNLYNLFRADGAEAGGVNLSSTGARPPETGVKI